MNLRTLFQILKKRLPAIIIITLLIGGSSFFYGKSVATSTYTAETSVLITKPKLNQSEVNSNNVTYIINHDEFDLYTKQINSYIDFANTKAVRNHIIQTLNLDMKSDELKSKITITPEGNTGFLTLTATTSDPKLSQQIVNQYAQSLKQVSTTTKNVDSVVLGDVAPLPEGTASIGPSFFGKVGILLGFMISLGVVFFLEVFNMKK